MAASLHAAAELLVAGETKVCQVFEDLLNKGADPNGRHGALEETALQVVLRQCDAESRLEVARILLEHGADPNVTDNCGEGPLFEATCNGDEAARDLLLAFGAKLATDSDEDVALEGSPAVAEPAGKTGDNVVLNMKHVSAQGKEWTLKKLARSDTSTNGDDPASSAALSSDDDSDYRSSARVKAVTTKAITSYLVSSEESLVSVYLKLDALFEGASEVFTDESAFKMQASAEHLSVSVYGPTSLQNSEVVCWQLSVPLPAIVDEERASLKLRKGKLTVKLPKAAGVSQQLTVEEEARAVARSEVPEAAKQSKPAKAPAKKAQPKVAKDAEDAVRAYGESLSAMQEEPVNDGSIFRRKAFPWRTDFSAAAPAAQFQRQEVRAELERDLRAGRKTGLPAAGGNLAGEEIHICCHCSLPVGDMAYVADGKEPRYLHGECLAQLRLLDLQKEDKARLRETSEIKKKRRAKYEIGWKVETIPRPMGAAAKLDLGFVPNGMCCLVYDEDSHSIGVLPTLDPMGSVNLEYLSLALQVRVLDGREPSFSLDLPAEAPGTPDTWMQKKRFEPEWLAGTSAGEVMFQADYHLKELSMGEYEQPVLGMKSCFDYSEVEEQGREWKAREWFVVREAEVNFTDNNVIVPSVKMGVQAREQIKGESGLEDVPITRPDHPLVKYAEAFTHNFDLIAERKSVIYHLRELAKATVLAKFIVDAELFLDESWLSLAEQAKDTGFKEIPQLWNERAYSQIRVRDGALVHQEKGDGRGSMFGVYGGVEFGVERFQLSRPGRIAPPPTASGMIVHKPTAVSFSLERFRIARPKRAVSVSAPAPVSVPTIISSAVSAAPVSAPVESRPPREFVPTHEVPVVRSSRPRSAVSAVSRVAVSRPSAVRGVEPVAAQPVAGIVASRLVQRAALVQRPGIFQRPSLQGVDLGLDQFNLSEAGRVDEGKGSWGLNTENLDACVSIGAAFWGGLEGDSAVAFKEEDKALLKDIFNPNLSDRREEGEAFVPPDRNPTCLLALRELLAEEASVREQRTTHFLSKEFVMAEPGPLFPASWKSTMGIERKSEKAREMLLARPDYKAEASMFDDALKSTVPVFDKNTEDGIRFRIYKIGSLEVRTTQAHGAKEVVGAVFSVRSASQGERRAEAQELLVKATQYVERAGASQCRYYVVLESEQGHAILTEKLADGSVAWEENPQDLEDRNSLAKVLRSADCRGAAVSVGDMQSFKSGGAARGASSKRYADSAFTQVAGETN